MVLSYGVDVLSMYFTHEKALNMIITAYDKNSSLSDEEIEHILRSTKEISP